MSNLVEKDLYMKTNLRNILMCIRVPNLSNVNFAHQHLQVWALKRLMKKVIWELRETNNRVIFYISTTTEKKYVKTEKLVLVLICKEE